MDIPGNLCSSSICSVCITFQTRKNRIRRV